MPLLIKASSRVCAGSLEAAVPTQAAVAVNNHNANFTRTYSSTSPLNATYHNSLRKLKNGERMILFRNNSLKRSFKKINNESLYPQPHHCTIELKPKASSCLHLFNKTPPLVLTTFRNQSDHHQDDQSKNNEMILWRYQHDISKTNSHCNLNHARQNSQTTANAAIATETKLNNSLENKTIL